MVKLYEDKQALRVCTQQEHQQWLNARKLLAEEELKMVNKARLLSRKHFVKVSDVDPEFFSKL